MDKLRIGIVTSPLGEAGRTPLSNLVDVVSSRTGLTYLVTGNAALGFFPHNLRTIVTGVHHREVENPLSRIVRHLLMQVQLALLMARKTRFVGTWIFFIGSDSLVIPMLMAKLTRRTVLLALAGSDEETLRVAEDRIARLVRLTSCINRKLSERLLLYSWSLVDEWHLGRYRSKVSVARHHFVDFTMFRETKSLKHRGNFVGYVGRMSDEKGIMQFIKAVPSALRQDPSLRFVVVGDGPLAEQVGDYVARFTLDKSVRIKGWIDHNDLPDLLNELKLLVIPSFTEGLPNIMLEAMACGTPVLATPVGAIRDVIRDGETGFILDDNSPESIASNITRVLEAPDFERVAERAQELVHISFTFERAVDSWRRVLERRYTDSG